MEVYSEMHLFMCIKINSEREWKEQLMEADRDPEPRTKNKVKSSDHKQSLKTVKNKHNQAVHHVECPLVSADCTIAKYYIYQHPTNHLK